MPGDHKQRSPIAVGRLCWVRYIHSRLLDRKSRYFPAEHGLHSPQKDLRWELLVEHRLVQLEVFAEALIGALYNRPLLFEGPLQARVSGQQVLA